MNVSRMIETGKIYLPLLALGLVTLTGCERQPMPPAQAAPTLAEPVVAMDAPVGFQVQPNLDPMALQKLVSSKQFGSRGNAWSLFPSEIAFENQQASERLWQATGGGFGNLHVPPVVDDPETRIEPQPYRRLAGVMVGETVAAIIIMEGEKAFIIRPGMQIPNSPWTVVSIDRDQAILRRGGSVLPKEITVRLENPPFGSSRPPAGGGRNVPGGQAPQNPDNPLGGKRGAPPGLGPGGAGSGG